MTHSFTKCKTAQGYSPLRDKGVQALPESIPTVRRKHLGAKLRQYREAMGLTLNEAGARLERADSTISRIETGKVRAHPREVEAMLDVYGVTDAKVREALTALARESRKRGWWHRYGDVLPDPYQDFISLESEARSMRTFQTTLVPGLLQTEDYAHAVMAGVPSGDKPRDIESLVAARIERQMILSRDRPLQLWAILSETVLRQVIGSRQTMKAQLQRLHDATNLDHVTIQVVPFDVGAHAGVDGSFVVLQFPEPADMEVVQLESMTGSLFLEHDEEIRRYATAFDHLRASALPENHSRALVARIEKEL